MKQVAVIGSGVAGAELIEAAEALGRGIAERGWTLITGGRGGVMEAASRGAASVGGSVVGILPGYSDAPNPHVGTVIRTGMGHARNAIVVASADAVVAVGGEAGTLSEIGLATKLGRPVLGLDLGEGWSARLPGLERVRDIPAVLAWLESRDDSALDRPLS